MTFLKTPRERGMAILFGAALGLMAAVALAERVVFEPLARKRTEIAALKTRAAELDFDAALVRRSQSRVADEALRSLPADPIEATLAYQNWLLETTRRCQLQEVHISPGRPIPEEHVGHRLPFTITCRGRFVALVNFLEHVRAADTLHRLSQISVTPEGTSATGDAPRIEELGMSIGLEALALDQAPETPSLAAATSIPPEHRLTRLKQLASGGNLFSRPAPPSAKKGSSKPPSVARTAPAEEAKPAETGTTLIACGTRDRVAEAWFHSPSLEDPIRVRLDEPFVVAGQTVRVAEIHPDAVVLATAEGRRRISLGERVEGEPSPRPTTPVITPTAKGTAAGTARPVGPGAGSAGPGAGSAAGTPPRAGFPGTAPAARAAAVRAAS